MNINIRSKNIYPFFFLVVNKIPKETKAYSKIDMFPERNPYKGIPLNANNKTSKVKKQFFNKNVFFRKNVVKQIEIDINKAQS